MRRILRMFFFVLLAPMLVAQSLPKTGSITTATPGAGNCVTAPAQNNSSVGIIVSGTWTGTLQPTLYIYSARAINKKVLAVDGTTAQATITANGGFVVNVGGFTNFSICASAFSSGTAVVDIFSTAAPNNSTIAAGGSSPAGNIPFDSAVNDLITPTADANFTFPNSAANGLVLSGTAPAAVGTATGTNAHPVLTINGVAGGADSNATGTAGIGSSPAVTGGIGGAGTGTNAVGGAGGSVGLTTGNGGASLGTGINSNGGNLNITLGTAGTGGSGTAGVDGVVFVKGPAVPKIFFGATTAAPFIGALNANVGEFGIGAGVTSGYNASGLLLTSGGALIGKATALSSASDTSFSRLAAAVWGQGTGAAGNSAGYVKNSQTPQVTGANFTTASTTLVTITGLTWPAPVSLASNWSFHCSIGYQVSASATVAFGIQGATTAPTSLYAQANLFTSNAGAAVEGSLTLTTTTATAIISAAQATTATTFQATIDGTLEAPSNATPTTLNFMADISTGTLTILRGSYCHID